MKKEESCFSALTPKVLQKNKKIYTDALNYAFSNNDVKNIAITGIYGSGKSTIWKTYVEEKDIKNIITITLGTYTDEIEPNSGKNDNRIEKQIINQISSQIDMAKIPLSKYKFKENKNKWLVALNTILSIIFVLSIIIFLNKDSLKSIEFIEKMYFINIEIFCLILFVVPLARFLFAIFRNNRFIFSRINIKGAEVNNTKTSYRADETVLDRDIKEIVYLIKSSNSKVVVFEDLDRYDDVAIFTKLRELNFLVNSRFEENEEVIRFIYMLRDSLFVSKNRTKFFDFILPIIPFIDSKNSEAKLLELLEHVEIKPSKNIIRQISYYIDDMRLLKNIVNEYVVYSSEDNIKIKELNLKEDKLFALIVLKNIFPLEFDNLQEDSGYIYSLFKTVEKLRESRKEEIEKSKKETENMIEFLESRSENSVFEAMALLIPSSVRVAYSNENWAAHLKSWSEDEERNVSISHSSGSQGMNYNTFKGKYITNNEENQKFIEKFSIDNSSKIDSLYVEIDNLNLELKNLRLKSVSELLNSLDTEELDGIFKGNKEGFELQNLKIVDEQYFSIIRFLILESLIDETYYNYKGYFHLGSIGKNDKMFLTSLLSRNKLDEFLELEHPNEVFVRLEEKDFNKSEILNRSLTEYCLNNNKVNEIRMISVTACDANDTKLIDILSEFSFEQIKNYAELLFEYNEKVLFFILENCSNQTELFKNILLGIYLVSINETKKIQLFNPYIEVNENILACLDGIETEKFYTNIKLANVKFKNMTESIASIDVLEKIAGLQVFEMSLNNVIFMANKLLGRKIIYSELITTIWTNTELISVKEYVEQYFVKFIIKYIEKSTDKDVFNNSEDVLIKIINENMENEYKKRYLLKNKKKLSDLEQIIDLTGKEKDGLLSILFNNNTLRLNSKNLALYWKIDLEYTDDFIDYLNYNVENLLNNNQKNLIRELFSKNNNVCNVLINEPKISDETFSVLLEFADNKISELDSKLSSSRISDIIEQNKVNLDNYNIRIIMDKDCNKSIIKLLGSDMSTGLIDKITTEQELIDRITTDFIYDLSNSLVDENETIKVIEKYTGEILIKNINQSKSNIIKYLLENRLSKKNVQYILDNFNIFKYKEIFVEEIYRQELLDEQELTLPLEFVDYVTNSKSVNSNFKVSVICKKIKEKKQLDKLPEWTRKISSLSIIPKIFNNKHPNYEGLSSDEYEIINSLESIDVVSVNRKIYLKPKVFDKYR